MDPIQLARPDAGRPPIPQPGIDALQVARRLGGGDRAVAAIAGRQHGAISTAQLLAAELSHDQIATRVARGWLHRRHRGVYLVGHDATTELTEAIAATLAVAPGAVLSHRSAARLHGMVESLPHPLDVSTPGRHRASRDGIRVRRVARLSERDLRVVERIPVVSPALALLGLAADTNPVTTQRALNEARAKRRISDRDLEELRGRTPRMAGWATLGELIRSEQGPDFSRREAELRLWQLIAAAGLPRPRRNAHAGGYEVDLYWPEHGLVVEVDGYAFHSSRAAFERDREKWANLQARRLAVLVFTWRQIVGRRQWVVARIASGLARGRR